MGSSLVNELGRVLVVGGGRMGQAIAQGILRIDGFDHDDLVVANPGAEKRAHIERSLGVSTVADAVEALPANVIIMAVKPAKVAEVATSLSRAGIEPGTLLISIAAGISTSSLEHVLGDDVSIVRIMPNTPLVVGCGMSAVSGGASCDARCVDLACELFGHMGKAVVVDEALQDVACAVSGSGPAYFELFAELIARKAQELGLDYDISLELVMQTMLGTAELIQQTHQSLPEAIDAVSSPGGTTVAALDAMRAAGIEGAIKDGVAAAAARSKELGA